MALVKITFDGSSVSSKQDADINFHLGSCVPAGIIRGLGNEVSYSVSNNYITFNSGYVQIYGRRIYVEAGTNIYVSLDSSKNGYIVIEVNLSENKVELKRIEQSGSYPTLTQDNLQLSGNIYQMPIARYTKSTTALTMDSSFSKPYIETLSNLAKASCTEAKNYADSNYGGFAQSYATESTSTTWKYKMNSWNYDPGLIIVNINDCVMIPVPSSFIDSHSNAYIYYMYDGSCYKLGVEKVSSDTFMFLTSTSSHQIKYIYCIR